jgi:3'-5' exoribonuclease
VARAKPILTRLSDLQPGQFADFYAFLSQRHRSATREGKPFFQCRFQDCRRAVTCMIWQDGGWFDQCDKDWQEGCAYKLRGVYEEHAKFGPQIEIHNIRPVLDADRDDGFNPAELVEHSRFDPDQMLAELQALVETNISDLPLRRLVLLILQAHGAKLKVVPATLNKFFPFRGGLLEHTISVTHSCLALAGRYADYYGALRPPLNRDLVVAGAVLHDLGRVAEFDGDWTVQPTVPGRLIGHLVLGRDLLRQAAAEVEELSPELLAMLEHLILSHLEHPEWGSPRLPLIPECLILHHADDLDAKLEMYVRALCRDQSQGPFTDPDPILKRQLLKGRTV